MLVFFYKQNIKGGGIWVPKPYFTIKRPTGLYTSTGQCEILANDQVPTMNSNGRRMFVPGGNRRSS
jgi:hypothetical protein